MAYDQHLEYNSFLDSQRHRLSFRNERTLYLRNCDATGDKMISIYPPDCEFPVYKSNYWYSDNWDPLEFGQDYDPNKNFFEQYKELQKKVPRLGLINISGINSDFCNMTYSNKNCYLVFGGDFNEDCMYGTLSMHNIDSLDLDYSNHNSLCYEMCDSMNCYNCKFTFNSKNCKDCQFISDCIGCSECLLCTNLNQKSYCILNKQYSKEEYFQKKAELLNQDSAQKTLFAEFLKMRSERKVKYAHIINSENCSGDNIQNSKNCLNCFDISDSEDLKNIVFATKVKDCFECSLLGEGTELCFNVIGGLKIYNSKCSLFIIESQNIEYSKYIFSSKDLFGCIGLQHKQYCILNKQYSKADYHKLRETIIEEMKKSKQWEQFFPKELSDYCYNETSAHDYFPLSKEEAIKQGYRWRDQEEKKKEQEKEDQCKSCQKAYKILKQELDFYQKMKITTPEICENCRHKRRMELRNPRKLWSRNCSNCDIKLESSYSPDRSEEILCEKCYQQIVL